MRARLEAWRRARGRRATLRYALAFAAGAALEGGHADRAFKLPNPFYFIGR